jgi:hypothetical protein
MEKQYVYIFSISDKPDLIKVGKSSKNPHIRANDLSKNTAATGRFSVEWFMEVPDAELAENIAHFKLKEYHFNKEYFSIKSHKAHFILEKFLIPLFELEQPIIEYSESLKDEIIRKENLALKYKNRLKLQQEEFTIIEDEEIKQKNRKERIKNAEEESEEFTSLERKKRIENATEISIELSKKYNKEERGERIKKFHEQAKEYTLSERE